MKQKVKFPEGFLWGAATAAHQIEGNNPNSDWWAWEHSKDRELGLRVKGLEPENFYSGVACDSYNRFSEDFAIAQSLNHNATRLSVEWAKLEPKEGEFNEKEFEHYEKVLQEAKFRGLKIFVTLHHFTNPIWFAKKGGFEHKANVKYFVRFAEKAVKRLGGDMDFVITINEPEIYAGLSYMSGVWPPQKKNLFFYIKVVKNLILAHKQASEKIKTIRKIPVSMAFHLHDNQPYGVFGKLAVKVANYFGNHYFLDRTAKYCDFLGINYYFHHHIGIFGQRKISHSHHEQSDLGWGIHPEGLEKVLLLVKKYNKPVYITENGLADAKDVKREKFIKDHLFYLHKAIKEGVDVRGYLHWSLLDNFEWAEGFAPRFGLVEIDRKNNLERKIRKSALAYAEICKSDEMEYEE